MHICYLDESGAPEPAGTSHFIVLGLALPVTSWKSRDADLASIKAKHRLSGIEIHTAWMLRKYPEQFRIQGLQELSDADRRAAVMRERHSDLMKASLRGNKAVKRLRINYRETDCYIHLTYDERLNAVREIADAVGSWGEVVLFGDGQLKSAHAGTPQRLFSYAFEQVVSRFHHFLDAIGGNSIGMLVQDNNQTAAKHLTALMRQFHSQGTKYVQIPRIIETPLFVDSKLTGMVQLADLCAYATRRFFELSETDLFDRIYQRFDRIPTSRRLVGLRHFTASNQCDCKVCKDHGR